MANLPMNNQYNTGFSPPSDTAIQNVRNALSKNPSARINFQQGESFSGQYMNQKRDTPDIPAGSRIQEPESATTPIPEEYGTFDQRFDQPSENAHLLNYGGGQIVTDPSQEGSFIRTNRPDYSPEQWKAQNSLYLGGRSSDLYQVDHIVPLWAGGADTASNKQVITRYEHNKKTNAQAVPLTLRANDLITAEEARQWAVLWKDLDLTDVPDVDDTGMIPVEQAKDIFELWKDQRKRGVAVVDNKPMTGWNFIKEALSPGNLREASTKVGDNLVPDFIPGNKYIESTVQGLASGITGGWVKNETPEDANIIQKGLNLAGGFAGMFVPVGMMSKGLGLVAKGAVSTIGKNAASKGFSFTSKGMANAMNNFGSRFVPKQISSQAPKYVRNAAFKNAAKIGAAFTVYGQMSREGVLGEIGEALSSDLAEENIADWSTRLLDDVVYGAVTGVASPTLKGAALVMSTPIFMGMMNQHFAEEKDEDWWTEALMTAMVMGTFHYGLSRGSSWLVKNEKAGVGRLPSGERLALPAPGGTVAGAVENTPLFKLGMVQDDAATHTAAGILEEFVPNAGFRKKGNILEQGASEYSADRIEAAVEEAKDMLTKFAYNLERPPKKFDDLVNMSSDEYAAEMSRITAAGQQLQRRGLTLEERETANLQDLFSVFERFRKDGVGESELKINNLYAPASIKNIIDDIPEEMIKKSLRDGDYVPKESGEFLTTKAPNNEVAANYQRVTGVADNISHLRNKQATEWINGFERPNKQGMVSSPMMVIVERPDLSFVARRYRRLLRKSIEEGKMKPGERSESADMDTILDVYGIMYNPQTGERSVVSLGRVPTIERVVGKYKYSFNNEYQVQLYKKTDGLQGKLPLSTKVNNVSLAKEMQKNETPILFANVVKEHTKVLPSKGDSGIRPIIHFSVNDANWSSTLEIAKKARKSNPSPQAEQSLKMSEAAKAVEKRMEVAKPKNEFHTASDKILEPVDKVLFKATEVGGTIPQPGLEMTRGYFEAIRKAIGDPDSVPEIRRAMAKIGVYVSPEEAERLFLTRENLTELETVKFVLEKINSGETTSSFSEPFLGTVLPIYKSAKFRQWSEQPNFNFGELKLLGGAAAKKKKTSAATSVTAKKPAAETAPPRQQELPIETPAKKQELPIEQAPATPTAKKAAGAVNTVAGEASPLANRVSQQFLLTPWAKSKIPQRMADAKAVRKQGRPVTTSKAIEEAYYEGIDESISRGYQKDRISDRESFAKELGKIIAEAEINPKGLPRGTNIQAANKELREKLTGYFQEQLEGFSLKEEMDFRGIAFGNEYMDDQMMKYLRARTVKSLGDNKAYDKMIAEIDTEDLYKIAEKLETNMDADDAGATIAGLISAKKRGLNHLKKEGEKVPDEALEELKSIGEDAEELAEGMLTKGKKAKEYSGPLSDVEKQGISQSREQRAQDFMNRVKNITPESDPYVAAVTIGPKLAFKRLFKNSRAFNDKDFADNPKAQQALGAALERLERDSGEGLKRMFDLHGKNTVTGGGGEFTQPLARLRAMAVGDDKGTLLADAKRKAQLEKEKADMDLYVPERDKAIETFGVAGEASEQLGADDLTSFARLVRDVQAGDNAVPVTRGEMVGTLYPSLAGGMEPQTVKEGIVDARKLVQMVMKAHNDNVSEAVETLKKEVQGLLKRGYKKTSLEVINLENQIKEKNKERLGFHNWKRGETPGPEKNARVQAETNKVFEGIEQNIKDALEKVKSNKVVDEAPTGPVDTTYTGPRMSAWSPELYGDFK